LVPPGVLASLRRLQEFALTLPWSLPKPLRWIIGAAASCAILVIAAAQLVDRPVATWVHEHLGDERFGLFSANYDGHLLTVGPFGLMAGPAQALGPVAAVVLGCLAVAAAAGWRPEMRGRIVLMLCLSILVAMEINAQAKSLFGRTWPESWLGDNPSWIRDSVFGFFPFHGGTGWGSFPSGHTTIVTTPATVLWFVSPELRVVWATMVAVVVAGLIGGNYHFVSDIVGGLYLGVGTGIGMRALMLSPLDRLR
jgi:membrane-associated phospholipid phosphatase